MGVSITFLPHDFRMCLIIRRSQTHSRLASYRTIKFEWLVDVATSVCFTNCHEMVAPPQINTKPVCDLVLWGRTYNQHSHNPPYSYPSFRKLQPKVLSAFQISEDGFHANPMSFGGCGIVPGKQIYCNCNI
jgi:hypothetical protein